MYIRYHCIFLCTPFSKANYLIKNVIVIYHRDCKFVEFLCILFHCALLTTSFYCLNVHLKKFCPWIFFSELTIWLSNQNKCACSRIHPESLSATLSCVILCSFCIRHSSCWLLYSKMFQLLWVIILKIQYLFHLYNFYENKLW